MKRKIKAVAKLFLRPGTRRHRIVRSAMSRLGLMKPIPKDVQYLEWVEFTEPNLTLANEDDKITYRPLISVIVPVFNVPANDFYPMVYSVVGQTYDNWELLLINASSDMSCREMTRDTVSIDDRIRIVELKKNKGIAENTNAGLAEANGEYVALLDHDDLYAPDALMCAVRVMQSGNKPALIYSDEDKLSADGEERFDPHFKSAWDINLLRQVNYLNHLTVLQKKVLDEVGGYRTGFDGAQDYDLYLRVVDASDGNVIHIPKVLYHWRAAATSTAQNFSVKKNILDAGRRAIEDHLKRNSLEGEVSPIKNQPGFYRIRYSPPVKLPHVAIICAFSSSKDQIEQYLSQLVSMTSYAGKVTLYSQSISLSSELSKNIIDFHHHQLTDHDNLLSDLCNGLDDSTIIVKVDAAVVPRSKKWLQEVVGCISQQKSVGAVTPLTLIRESSIIYDFGYFNDGKRALISPFKGAVEGMHTYFGNSNWTREVQAVGTCIFITKSTILKKYFSEHATYDRNEFSQYLGAQRLCIIAWPFARFSYYGHLNNSMIIDTGFSPILKVVDNRFTLATTINVPSRISRS